MNKDFNIRKTEETPDESKSSQSSSFWKFETPERHINKYNLSDYYIKQTNNNNHIYNLDIITSKLKKNVSYLDKEHQMGLLKFKKGNQSQKFSLYHDKLIHLNFKNFNNILYDKEEDYASNKATIDYGKEQCRLDLDSAIKHFDKRNVNCLYNYNKRKKFFNFDNESQKENINKENNEINQSIKDKEKFKTNRIIKDDVNYKLNLERTNQNNYSNNNGKSLFDNEEDNKLNIDSIKFNDNFELLFSNDNLPSDSNDDLNL